MNRILFMFIIYPSCEGALRKERMKSKIVRKWYFGNTIFLTSMIIYDYFSPVFCIVPKKALLLKYRKWVNHLKNRYHYAKVVENARINFSISPYCTLLFSRKENFKFFEVALSAVLCNGAVGCIMNVWGYQHWNTANTTLDFYLLFINGHKSTHQYWKLPWNFEVLLLTSDYVPEMARNRLRKLWFWKITFKKMK